MVYRQGHTVFKSDNPPDTNNIVNDTIRRADNSVASTADFTCPVAHNASSIVYTTRPRGQRDQSNSCKQEELTYKVTPVTRTGSYTAFPGWTYSITSPDSGNLSRMPTVIAAVDAAFPGNSGFGVINVGGQGYINDAFGSLKPDLTELSIPNFLLELDEVPGLIKLWSSKLSTLRNLAGLRLNWSFGWAPFVGDLEAIKDIFVGIINKCKQWQQMENFILKRSKKFPSLGGTVSGTFAHNSTWTCHWTATRTCTVSAHLRFKLLRIPKLEETLTVMRVYLDALGFELNPKIVWDAIPFTFVIDWFFDVGGWLQRHKYDTLELPVMLVDSCLQCKEDLTITYYSTDTSTAYSPTLRSAVSEVNRKIFHRLPIFPDQSAATAAGWKIPSSRQLINLFSLGTVLSRR